MNHLFPQNFTSISLIREYGFWNQKMRKFSCLFPRIIFIPAAKFGLGFHIREMKPQIQKMRNIICLVSGRKSSSCTGFAF